MTDDGDRLVESMVMYHKLDDDKNVVPLELDGLDTTEKYKRIGEVFEIENRRVAETTLDNGMRVSTVFLVFDHGYCGEGSLFFETMVFEGEGNYEEQDIDRYATWAEAVAGHEAMVEKWKEKKGSNQ